MMDACETEHDATFSAERYEFLVGEFTVEFGAEAFEPGDIWAKDIKMAIRTFSDDHEEYVIGKVEATLFKMDHFSIGYDAYDSRSAQLANAYDEMFGTDNYTKPVLRKKTLQYRFDYHLHISELAIDSSHRGFGVGTKALKMMRDFVDRENLVISLYPCPPGQNPTKKEHTRLINFYQRNGFRRLKTRVSSKHLPLMFWDAER